MELPYFEEIANNYRVGDLLRVSTGTESPPQYIGCLVEITSVHPKWYHTEIICDRNDDDWIREDGMCLRAETRYFSDHELEPLERWL